MGVSFCTLLILYKPSFTWPGLLIALAGIPIYYWTGRYKESDQSDMVEEELFHPKNF